MQNNYHFLISTALHFLKCCKEGILKGSFGLGFQRDLMKNCKINAKIPPTVRGVTNIPIIPPKTFPLVHSFINIYTPNAIIKTIIIWKIYMLIPLRN